MREHMIFDHVVRPIEPTSLTAEQLQYLSINQVYNLQSTTCV